MHPLLPSSLLFILLATLAFAGDGATVPLAGGRSAGDELISAATTALAGQHPAQDSQALRESVARVAARWTPADGDAAEFVRFCTTCYVADPQDRRRLLERLETVLTATYGHLAEIGRTAHQWKEMAGDDLPGVDDVLGAFDPAPDLAEQLYRQRIALVLLLNFTPPTLAEMERAGRGWTVEQWVAARLTRGLPPRVPGDVQLAVRQRQIAAQNWMYGVNVHVGTLVDADGRKLYEPGTTLLAHWKLRDESILAYGQPGALARQRALMWVMRRMIDGTLPAVVLERDPDGTWDPQANTIGGRPVSATIGLVRYEHWLALFAGERTLDPYYPEQSTALARAWDLYREVPVARVEQILTDLLRAPVRKQLHAFMQQRLGRPLEPHDVYWDIPFERPPTAELDAAVARRFATIDDFGRALPAILREVGFCEADADWLAGRIRVGPSRDAGHCTPSALPEYGPWLCTSLNRGVFDFGAYGTAMHELGHAVEAAFSTARAPRPALRGVPGSCGVESVANVLCETRFRIVGANSSIGGVDALDQDTIGTLIGACQIAGPGLVELRAWRWLYEHPQATAAELREQVLELAADVWREFYEEHFGPDPYCLAAAYQHMLGYPLYLANYALSGVALQQVRAHVRGKPLAPELIRMYTLGRVTPDLWMERAVGAPLSVEPLLKDAERVLSRLAQQPRQ